MASVALSAERERRTENLFHMLSCLVPYLMGDKWAPLYESKIILTTCVEIKEKFFYDSSLL